MTTTPPAKRIRLTAEARRTLIVDAALRAIADEGFEGLRTRDIAATVNINSATLHHHFPTKNDLIEAVAKELKRRFQTDRAPRTANTSSSAIAALEGQLADLDYYRSKRPELLAVYREFVARSPRDPSMARLVRQLDESWRRDLLHMLEQASREGILRPGVDPVLASHVAMHTLRGLTASRQSVQDIRSLSRRVIALLVEMPG